MTIRWPGSEKGIRVRCPTKRKDLEELHSGCLLWSYLVLRRLRWNTSEHGRDDLGTRAEEFLESLGVKEAALKELAKAGAAEVSIPYYAEKEGWFWRILPWEYLLSSATRRHRSRALTIVRHLDNRSGCEYHATDGHGVTVLISAPADVYEAYDFTTERAMVRSALDEMQPVPLESPTLEWIRRQMQEHGPAVVHVGGVDSHEGHWLLGIPRPTSPLLDGVVLSDAEGRPVHVSSQELAAAIVSYPDATPRLVVFNLYRSAARTAPLCVAAGASAAIGFQDTFDDLAAEIFLGEFYRTWQKSEDLLIAFELAWEALRDYPKRLSGSGIVLWSARPLLTEDCSDIKDRLETSRAQLVAARPQHQDLSPEEVKNAANELRIEYKAPQEINYALLHNREPIYRKFRIANPGQVWVPDLKIEVELFAGSEPIKCNAQIPVPMHPISVTDQLFLPLTSRLMRGLGEKVRANLATRVSVADHSLANWVNRVTLLPINQWIDDDQQRQWLPSFVFPLDPAVLRIIAAAQPHLRVITDSWSVGFDGYQGVDENLEDPTASVDNQVAAIWTALVQDFSLGYINPPPTYTALSQRLRTPSQVIDNRRGTCIDLALLLAACCEYVGLYPVIFLLEGHAFPGYWRSEEAWYHFVDMDDVAKLREDSFDEMFDLLDDYPQNHSWVFGRADQRMLLDAVKRGDLVPIESTWLTATSSFDDAIDEGYANLRPKKEFEALIDIMVAREADVTPLPIDGGVS